MADKYSNFEELATNEVEGVDYTILVNDIGSDITCIAPHGGSIEGGTTEIVDEVASDKYNSYSFNGIKASNNMDLHITSTRFDEPQLIKLVKKTKQNISIHGFAGDIPRTYIGGLNSKLIESISRELTNAGFRVDIPTEGIGGYKTTNFVNKGLNGLGVQLEISTGQRRLFFENNDISSANRKNKTDLFYKYCNCLKIALAHEVERDIDLNTTCKMNFRKNLNNGTNELLKFLVLEVKKLKEEIKELKAKS